MLNAWNTADPDSDLTLAPGSDMAIAEGSDMSLDANSGASDVVSESGGTDLSAGPRRGAGGPARVSRRAL